MKPISIFHNVVVVTEIKNVGKDRPIVPIRVVYNGKYKDKAGVEVKTSDFFPIVFYGKAAEIMLKYGRKGMRMNLVCQPKDDRYKDKDGKDRSVTQFRADEFEIISPRADSAPSGDSGTRRPAFEDDADMAEMEKDFGSDDIPF